MTTLYYPGQVVGWAGPIRAETEVPATQPDPDYFDDSPAEETETDPEAEVSPGSEPDQGALP